MTDQLKNDIHMELSQKLTATDAVLKDQVGKMVRSKVRAFGDHDNR